MIKYKVSYVNRSINYAIVRTDGYKTRESSLMGRNEALLKVENLNMYFPIKSGTLNRKVADLKVVDGISFHIKRGETTHKSARVNKGIRTFYDRKMKLSRSY